MKNNNRVSVKTQGQLVLILFANVSLPLVMCLVSLSCPQSDMLKSML